MSRSLRLFVTYRNCAAAPVFRPAFDCLVEYFAFFPPRWDYKSRFCACFLYLCLTRFFTRLISRLRQRLMPRGHVFEAFVAVFFIASVIGWIIVVCGSFGFCAAVLFIHIFALFDSCSRVCSNQYAIIRKYGLNICRQCFRQYADQVRTAWRLPLLYGSSFSLNGLRPSPHPLTRL